MTLTNELVERNGTTRPRGQRKPGKAPGVACKPRTRSKASRGLSLARKVALAVGGVGVGVLGLSVAHCTESIGLLTGSPVALSALLAVGIDAGMVACELAELVSHGTAAERRVGPWARAYIAVAVLLSILLNGYAFGLHAADGMRWAGWMLGACVPGLVYALGRVAGHLWMHAE
jgi:hypothetical protein